MSRANVPQARTITLVRGQDGNTWSIYEGDGYCDRLTWDEMLGQVASMTITPAHGRPAGLFGMSTADEHARRRDFNRRRWVPMDGKLGEMVVHGLTAYCRELGTRHGEFDELRPWFEQNDPRVRLAMMLLDANRDPAPYVVDAEVTRKAAGLA